MTVGLHAECELLGATESVGPRTFSHSARWPVHLRLPQVHIPIHVYYARNEQKTAGLN